MLKVEKLGFFLGNMRYEELPNHTAEIHTRGQSRDQFRVASPANFCQVLPIFANLIISKLILAFLPIRATRLTTDTNICNNNWAIIMGKVRITSGAKYCLFILYVHHFWGNNSSVQMENVVRVPFAQTIKIYMLPGGWRAKRNDRRTYDDSGNAEKYDK